MGLLTGSIVACEAGKPIEQINLGIVRVQPRRRRRVVMAAFFGMIEVQILILAAAFAEYAFRAHGQ